MRKVLFTSFMILLLSGCSGFSLRNMDANLAVGAVSDLANAATVSDAEIKKTARSFADVSDKTNKIAPATNKYAIRLAKLTNRFKNDSGLNLNFKAYLSKTENAFALADGSIRVYSTLMDRLDDDELLFVIGHEIGHIKNGDSASETRTTLITSAARKGVAAQSNVAGRLAASELGGLLEQVIGAQYSQSQERAADDFGLAFLKRGGRKQAGAVSCLRKLAQLDDSVHILSSHPSSSSRADRLEDSIA